MNPASSPKRAVICVAIIALTTIYMAVSTWKTWPDPIYDFGTNLYIPWQILRGKHLYSDIAYFNGPFSEYFNALAFRIFGLSFRTLILVNLTITLAVITVIFRIVKHTADAVTATAACVIFITLFAFSNYVGIGNYNWICPYTHEVTHGVAMSLAMIACLAKFGDSQRRIDAILRGALLGLIFLTKAEIFAPAALVFGLAILLQRSLRLALLASFTFAAVVLAAFGAIACQTHSASVAMTGVLGSWPWVFDRRIAALQFYRQGLGIDDLPGNLRKMLFMGIAWLLLLVTVTMIGIVPRRRRWGVGILLIAELICIAGAGPMILQLARPWPIFLLITTGISILQARRGGSPAVLRALFSLFALALLVKMFFNARIWQYGFALAFPAVIVGVVALLHWIPAQLTLRGYDGPVVRKAAMLMLAVLTIDVHFNQPKAQAGVAVGRDADEFFSGPRGAEVNHAVQTIHSLIGKTDTMTVMPQGLMLNYLTRHSSPISAVNLMPPEVLSIGEYRIITELERHPPNWIVISEKDTADGAFILTEGRYHYGKAVLDWVKSHYVGRVPADAKSELKLSFWKLSPMTN